MVGDIYEHRPGRTITETDNTWFTLLTMNTHPLHFDEEYGKDGVRPLHRRARPLTVAHDGRHERDRRQPEGDRQPRLERHPADASACSPATRCMPNPKCWRSANPARARPRAS